MSGVLCVDPTHTNGWQCARCNRTYCYTCDQPSDVETIKTLVRYCGDWRCERERQLEHGELITISPTAKP